MKGRIILPHIVLFSPSDLYKEYGLFQRLTKLEEEFKGANILLFKHQKIPKVILLISLSGALQVKGIACLQLAPI